MGIWEAILKNHFNCTHRTSRLGEVEHIHVPPSRPQAPQQYVNIKKAKCLHEVTSSMIVKYSVILNDIEKSQ